MDISITFVSCDQNNQVQNVISYLNLDVLLKSIVIDESGNSGLVLLVICALHHMTFFFSQGIMRNKPEIFLHCHIAVLRLPPHVLYHKMGFFSVCQSAVNG